MNARGRRKFTLTGVLFVLVVACAGAVVSHASAGKTTTTVTFFSANGITGQSAFYGKGSLKEQQLLMTKINNAGGFLDKCGNRYKIALKTWDDADSPAQAVAGMQKAASDSSVLGVIGSTSDVAWLPELPVAGQLKLPLIIPSDGSDVPAKKWNPYAFRVYGSASATWDAAFGILKRTIHPKKIGVIYDITQDSEAAEAVLWKNNASHFGYKVTAYESYRAGDTDFRSQLTAIKATNPDLIVIDSSEREASLIYNQATQLGLLPKVPAYSAYGINATTTLWNLTHGAVKGSYSFTQAAVGPGVKMHDASAAKLYDRAVGQYPNTFQISGWDGLNLAIQGVKMSCTATDRGKFRAALASIKHFPLSTQGYVTWHNPPTGENLSPTAVVLKVTKPGAFAVLK